MSANPMSSKLTRSPRFGRSTRKDGATGVPTVRLVIEAIRVASHTSTVVVFVPALYVIVLTLVCTGCATADTCAVTSEPAII